ncbi:rod-binding protein [Sphingomonas quercus]|uniref:Rod-binding protein n=1 Tax=Sphingomonas quercus TaxID=2842451 RepID=A0ABS6BJY7_9SPHN|nr:rod-binding protein [Sphingomonas quercus]MBU3078615.1 rod-binding protein [Sphingomonas quercus]
MADMEMPSLPPPSGPTLPRAGTGPGKDMAKTARDFESVFIGQMTKLMMESAKPAEGFSGGNGEEIFRGVLAEELGKEIAKRGGIGLAPAVLNQMIQMQGGASRDR